MYLCSGSNIGKTAVQSIGVTNQRLIKKLRPDRWAENQWGFITYQHTDHKINYQCNHTKYAHTILFIPKVDMTSCLCFWHFHEKHNHLSNQTFGWVSNWRRSHWPGKRYFLSDFNQNFKDRWKWFLWRSKRVVLSSSSDCAILNMKWLCKIPHALLFLLLQELQKFGSTSKQDLRKICTFKK